jgi:hypothetical protein
MMFGSFCRVFTRIDKAPTLDKHRARPILRTDDFNNVENEVTRCFANALTNRPKDRENDLPVLPATIVQRRFVGGSLQ